MPVAKPSLNLVATLYGWSITRFARRRAAGPAEIEAVMAANRWSRPRFVVFYILGGYLLEIGGAAAVGAAVLVLVAHYAGVINHAVSSALDLAGALLGAFPFSIMLAVCVWAIFPEKRVGGYFRNPQRLWLPSILTIFFTIGGGLALWRGW